MRHTLTVAAVATLAASIVGTHTVRAEGPTTAPTTPATTHASHGATIAPEAQALLDELGAAVAGATSLEMNGQMRLDMSVAGRERHEQASFSATYLAPNRFRHQMDRDVLVGSTGEALFIHDLSANIYTTEPITSETLHVGPPYDALLHAQNPGLDLLLSGNVSKALSERFETIERAPDVEIDGQVHPALSLVNADGDETTIALDAKTHLVRRVTCDLRKQLSARGAVDVAQAEVVIDYASVNAEAALDEASFAWSAPEGARQASFAGLPGGEASNLIGKPAPDFALPDMSDQIVRLAALRGQVVVIDFWATWCGPCVAAMPGLEEIHTDFADRGVKVLAINVREDVDQVQGFLTSRNLTLTTLRDADGRVSDSYGVQGIPTTLVVDQGGRVSQVFVGSGNDVKIREAVTKLLGD